jgi:hypothetical protein
LTNHCHEYGEVPVFGIVPVTVRVWSASSFAALIVGTAGAVRADRTVTVGDAGEVTVTATVALSVTRSSRA